MAQKATIAAIARFLNRTLRVRSIKDASVNGLQVRSRKAGQIRTVGFAVDGCLSTFEQARKLGVELLVVHHGIAWRPQKDRDLEKGRAAWLRKNNMALYAAHLPLDLQEEYGNNMQLCRLLGVQYPKKFGRYHGIKIGYAGTFKRAVSLDAVASVLNRGLDTKCRIFPFGSKRLRSIGIISGGGGSPKEVCTAAVDCFWWERSIWRVQRSKRQEPIVAGHYATETPG
jgi:putative NIF3 family GTP cyclohydrolase 1 type 2